MRSVNIVLINHQGQKLVKGLQIQTPSAPIGLAYIGAYIKANGYCYTGIDACGEALDNFYESGEKDILLQGLTNQQVLDRIPKDTQIFGFTSLFSHSWPIVSEMATFLRSYYPKALFVCGGEHPSAFPEQVLKTNYSSVFDVVVVGEGEETFLDIIKCVELGNSWRDLNGIAYLEGENVVATTRRKRVKKIDEFPIPDWDTWSINGYIDANQVSGINLGRSMPILGSRGCPYACTFCSNEDMWERRYIMRDAKSLIDEMEYMVKKYNVTGFTFMDSTFIINKQKIKNFCRELIERNLNINYQLPAGTRCEAFDEEMVELLEASGLKNLALAPESGSDYIRKIIKKQIKLENLFKVVKLLKKSKITVSCFIVIGFPEDTHKTMRETMSLVRKLALLGIDDITVSKFTPYPGSPLWKTLVDSGRISVNFSELKNIVSFFDDFGKSYSNELSFKQLHSWMIKMFFNFYLISFAIRPWRLIQNFYNYFVHGIEKARYMRFFTEIFFLRRKWIKTEEVSGG